MLTKKPFRCVYVSCWKKEISYIYKKTKEEEEEDEEDELKC